MRPSTRSICVSVWNLKDTGLDMEVTAWAGPGQCLVGASDCLQSKCQNAPLPFLSVWRAKSGISRASVTCCPVRRRKIMCNVFSTPRNRTMCGGAMSLTHGQQPILLPRYVLYRVQCGVLCCCSALHCVAPLWRVLMGHGGCSYPSAIAGGVRTAPLRSFTGKWLMKHEVERGCVRGVEG